MSFLDYFITYIFHIVATEKFAVVFITLQLNFVAPFVNVIKLEWESAGILPSVYVMILLMRIPFT